MKKVIKNIKINNIFKMIIVTILIIVACGISIYIQKKEKLGIKINDKEFKSENGKISVYLSGAVNNVGIYSFSDGIRLEDALNVIGGVKPEADISKVNLVKVLYDCEKIVIPYIQEEKIENEKENQKGVEDTVSENMKININTANEAELMTLTGIGGVTAKKIIEYRKNGNFELIEDIMNVPGIGNSKFDKIKDKIVVE
jgi:competence protein ComEA